MRLYRCLIVWENRIALTVAVNQQSEHQPLVICFPYSRSSCCAAIPSVKFRSIHASCIRVRVGRILSRSTHVPWFVATHVAVNKSLSFFSLRYCNIILMASIRFFIFPSFPEFKSSILSR